MTDVNVPPRFVLKGRHVLAGFIVFFAIDIAVNAVFMVSAYRTFPGETSLTPYEDGVAYNVSLRQRHAQAVLGWRIAVGAEGPGRLRLEVRDRAGSPISGLRATAHIERPATQAGESDVDLRAAAAGVYVGNAPASGGFWDVSVTVRDGLGRVATAERRMALR